MSASSINFLTVVSELLVVFLESVTVHVYGSIHIYSTIHIYDIVHEKTVRVIQEFYGAKQGIMV